MKKIIVFLTLGAALLLSVSAIAGAQEGGQSSLLVTPQSYDFGTIYQEDGKVSTSFTVTNTGEEALTLNRLSTSCGCTKAEMDMSPLQSGENRTMLVTFDPQVHQDHTGSIIRMVYLQTSDAAQPEIELQLIANVQKLSGETGQQDEPDAISHPTQPVTENAGVIIFFNEACADCGELVNEHYPGLFAEYDYQLTKKDYINERESRKLLNEYNEKWGVPFELQSHIEAFVGDRLLIGGHVPEPIIRYLLEHPDEYDRLLVYQDQMHGEAADYRVWDFEGDIKTYPLNEPITTYLSGNGEKAKSTTINSDKSFWGLFAVITSSAFIDGINPCAIAVLLFFISFLFALKKSKKSIWKMGFVYIAAIYLAYFLIGIGIAQAIIISGYPHLMAYVGAYLVIGLGIIQILSVIFPKFPIKLRIPVNTKATLEKWLFKATIPAAFIGGFVVGLCTFPCSGGIYVAIIGMLATSQNYLQGLGWMVWYNLMFVAPLIILLFLAANSKTTEKLQQWERKEARHTKILIGLTMIVLGLIILFFFI